MTAIGTATLITRVGTPHSRHILPLPTPVSTMLTKHFRLTQVYILPFSYIENSSGGMGVLTVIW